MAVPRVYTTRFIAYQGLDSSAPAGYLVPPGYIAVVRNIDVYHGQNILDADYILMKSITGGWTFWATSVAATEQHEWRGWTGRVAFHEGEEFAFEVLNGVWDVTCSGYLFLAT